ncbi:MAG: hypothetical protein BM556_15550 [Bacteriovorax sp. MedPE-SWde]|nr:MAG: hypothetical protein BM556_15550 [Bacteriovorax sp. MedPE-SWde]
MKNIIYYLFILSTFLSCANVKQIDRSRLSSKIMKIDPKPEEQAFLEEINSYREGAAGGSSSVGGGCGCN